MDRKYMVLLGMGLELVALTLAFLYIGRYLDDKMGWSGFATAGGAILAIAVWLVHLVQVVNQLDASHDE